MRALRFIRGQLALHDIPVPDDGSEALVRVIKSGICNTDLEIVRGYAGFEGTIGHEFVGVVERADDRPEIVGKRVVGEINAGCGVCEKCLAAIRGIVRSGRCLGIVGRDGAHAEFLQLPSRNLIEVPDDVTDEQAVFTEPLAAAYGITEQVADRSRYNSRGHRRRQARPVVRDDNGVAIVRRHADRQTRPRWRSPTTASTAFCSMILGQQCQRTFDVVVEASGSESGFATALDLVRPRGKIVLEIDLSRHPDMGSLACRRR